MDTDPAMRTYGFVDWSGDTGFKFTLGSSPYLALSLVSSADYAKLRQGLIKLRGQLKLPRTFEFHFAHNSKMVRTAFFAVLPHLPWDSAQNPCGVLHFTRNSEGGVLGFSKKLFLSSTVLIVDKRRLSVDFAKMREPTLYGFFLGQLLARAPLRLIKVKRLLIDDEAKRSPLVCGMRIAASSILLARGVKRTPKMRGEPAHRWDGLQVSGYAGRGVNETSAWRYELSMGLETRLRVYHYEAIK